jgi:hypothetical protein
LCNWSDRQSEHFIIQILNHHTRDIGPHTINRISSMHLSLSKVFVSLAHTLSVTGLPPVRAIGAIVIINQWRPTRRFAAFHRRTRPKCQIPLWNRVELLPLHPNLSPPGDRCVSDRRCNGDSFVRPSPRLRRTI